MYLYPKRCFLLQSPSKGCETENVATFIESEILTIPGVYLNNQSREDQYGKLKLNVNLNGTYIDTDSIPALKSRLENYILACDLNIIQPQPIGFKEQRLASLKTDIISELYENSSRTIKNKRQ